MQNIHPNQIGLALRILRQQRSETLRQVSNATGLSVSFLSDMERGETAPSLRTISKIAHHFGFHFRIALIKNDTIIREGQNE